MDHMLEEDGAPLNSARRTFIAQAAATSTLLVANAVPSWAQTKDGVSPAPARPFIADTLARYATQLKYEDLPHEVVRTAKRIVLDTLGCAIGGYDAGPSQIAVKIASTVTATTAATML